jgi:hypothetical protein
MPRETRIKLIVGLSFTILGLLVAYVVTPVVAHYLVDKASAGGFKQIDNWAARAAEFEQIVWVTFALKAGGLGVAISAALFSFAVFAIWLVGPPEKK